MMNFGPRQLINNVDTVNGGRAPTAVPLLRDGVNWSPLCCGAPATRRWKSVRDPSRGARRQRWEGEFQIAATTVKFAQRPGCPVFRHSAAVSRRRQHRLVRRAAGAFTSRRRTTNSTSPPRVTATLQTQTGAASLTLLHPTRRLGRAVTAGPPPSRRVGSTSVSSR